MIRKYTDEEFEKAKTKDKLLLECVECSKDFPKDKRLILAVMKGQKFATCKFCSDECVRRHREREKNVIKKCANCKKTVKIQLSQVTENNFCTSSCAATFNNKKRRYSEKTKERISNSIRRYYSDRIKVKIPFENRFGVCRKCGKEILTLYRKYCSRYCSANRNIFINSSAEAKIKVEEFFLINQRIPTKRELVDVDKFLKKCKIKWNSFIKECGFEPNTKNLSKKRIKCKDLHIADSVSERIIDDFLFENHIEHKVHVKYPNCNFVSDFYLPETNQYIEYFGLVDEYKSYNDSIKRKKSYFEENNLNIIEIYPTDLFPINKLEDKFKLN